MSKDKITDYSVTQNSNTDIGGINIAENCDFGNVNDALREQMAQLAKTNAGTDPVDDTWTFADPADRTKRFRFDGGSIATGSTRIATVPDASGTLVFEGLAQTLTRKTFSDPTEPTKLLVFDLASISTSTTRTAVWPDANGTVFVSGAYPTLTSLEGLSLVSGDILYATAADTLQRLAKGAAYQGLRMNSGATAPEWGNDVGVGQTWQDVTASRVIGTIYQNSTAAPISVNVFMHGNDSAADSVFVLEVESAATPTVIASQGITTNFDNVIGPLSAIIPVGHYYRVRKLSGANSIYALKRWSELR